MYTDRTLSSICTALMSVFGCSLIPDTDNFIFSRNCT